jgi:glycosyltransferase involved in cell wall biosynthesis
MATAEGVGARTVRRVAVFAATSGHSGVDRVLTNLVTQWAAWGVPVDLLRVRNHGPQMEPLPEQVRSVDLGRAHVNGALPALVRYLRRERPAAMLTDKDRVNRVAIVARALARGDTRLAVRVGTTVSVNLRGRGAWERWLQRTSMRRLYPLADRVLVPSAGAADDLSAYAGLDRRCIAVVPSPIVTPELERETEEPTDHPWLVDSSVPVILGVGELGYRKDFETLIRAFALVRARRRCRLLILGRGRRREQLLRLADELGVGEDVDLPGFVRNPYAAMARARLFVLSSRWEGMPVVLIESLACRTPVVATDCPSGPGEILGDGSAGALVPVGDSASMAEAIGVWLDREVPDGVFEQAVAPYRIKASAGAYLRALGLDVPEPCAVD